MKYMTQKIKYGQYEKKHETNYNLQAITKNDDLIAQRRIAPLRGKSGKIGGLERRTMQKFKR